MKGGKWIMDCKFQVNLLSTSFFERSEIKNISDNSQRSFKNLYNSQRNKSLRSQRENNYRENSSRIDEQRSDADVKGRSENHSKGRLIEQRKNNEDEKEMEKWKVDDGEKNNTVNADNTTNNLKTKETVKTEDDAKDKEVELDSNKKEILKKIADKLNISVDSLTDVLKFHNLKDAVIDDSKLDSVVGKLSGLIDGSVLAKSGIMEEIKDLVKELGVDVAVKAEQISRIKNNQGGAATSVGEGKQINLQDALNKDEGSMKQENGNNDKVKLIQTEQTEQSDEKNKQEKVLSSDKSSVVDAESKVAVNGEAKKPNIVETGKTAEQEKVSEEASKSEAKAQKISKTGESHESNNGNTEEEQGKSWRDSIKVVNAGIEKPGADAKLQELNTMQINQGINDSKEVKMEAKVHLVQPNKEEILKQIIDKASVSVSQDKAEMIINLKPDNLGKLSLKVATEKGIVTAQILAENQQVKQIIESNFNVLRDALEKQGITVQQFSVSVGQDSWNKGFNQDNRGNSSKSNGKNQGISGITVNNPNYYDREKTGSIRMWPDSTINFTA